MRDWKVFFYEEGSSLGFDLTLNESDGSVTIYRDVDSNITYVPRVGEKVEFKLYGTLIKYSVIDVTYNLSEQDIRVDLKIIQ